MTFLQPLALLGLAAAAIPLLLHLFQRRTPPELDFPPVRWLTEAERRSARALRLRNLLLLLLRTTLIAVIVLAAARPVAPVPGGSGAHAPTALVVVLDNSPSSGAVSAGRPALDRLSAAARALLDRASPDDRLFLMLADGVVRAGGRAALLAALDSVAPGATRLDLTAAVTAGARLVHGEPLAAHEVHVLSDLQRSALAEGRADVPDGVTVLTLAPLRAPPVNRGVTAAAVRDGAVAVTVAGAAGAEAAPITLVVDGRETARALAAPGQTVSLTLPAVAPGWHVGEVRLPPDELRADDVRPLAWRVAPPAAVSVGSDAGPFVTAALAVLREAGRVRVGGAGAVRVGGAPGAGPAVVLPPADAALTGAANRALAAEGIRWRFGEVGAPGVIDSTTPGLAGIPVLRRRRLEGIPARDSSVLATVHGEPWLVRSGDVILVGSRFDTAWTALPARPAFVPFLDHLVNRVARGESAVAEREGPTGVTFSTRGGDTLGVTVSAPDPRESDLTPATPEEARRALGGATLSEAAFASAGFGGTGLSDLSGLLLLMALALAGAELWVAWRAR